jgi:hypothetical protein
MYSHAGFLFLKQRFEKYPWIRGYSRTLWDSLPSSAEMILNSLFEPLKQRRR